MDTMTITKAGGAACGALLVFMLGSFAGETIYSVGEESYGDEEHLQGYAIAVEESGGGDGEAVEEGPPFEEVFASASAADGETLWRQCAACHKLDGTDGTGPHLNGVVGRAKHSIEGYAYSEGLIGLEGDWTPEDISGFLLNPKEYAPGTKMSYRGMDDVADRANLIAYLESQG